MFAVQLLDDVGHGFVVAQRVEVVFVQSATAVGIEMCIRDRIMHDNAVPRPENTSFTFDDVCLAPGEQIGLHLSLIHI